MLVKAAVTSNLTLMADLCCTAEPKVSRARYTFCLLYCTAKSHERGNEELRQVIQSTTTFCLDHDCKIYSSPCKASQ